MQSQADVENILAKVAFRPSCVNLDWKWELKPVYSAPPESDISGWLIRTSFVRPDTDSGEIQRGFGRWEYVEKGTSISGVVKTCWLLAELIVRHELMEAFTYEGSKIFDPHHAVGILKSAQTVQIIMNQKEQASPSP